MQQFKYGKKEANTIKSIAILMMIFHHLFGFPSWILEKNMYHEFTIGNYPLFHTLALYCKVTVGLFIFTTGYSLAIDEDKKSSYKYIVRKLFAFLKKVLVYFCTDSFYWVYYK